MVVVLALVIVLSLIVYLPTVVVGMIAVAIMRENVTLAQTWLN